MSSFVTPSRARKFLRFIGGRAIFWLALSALCGLILSFAEVAAASLLQILLQNLKLTRDPIQLPLGLHLPELSGVLLAIAFLVVALIRSTVSFLVSYSAAFANQIVQLRMNLLLYHEALDQPRGFTSLAEFQFRSATVFPKAVQFCNTLVQAIPNYINLLGLLTMLFLINWKAALISTLSVLLIGIPTAYLNRRIRNRSHITKNQMMALNHRIHASVRNYFFLKALGMNRKVLDDLVDQSLAITTNTLRVNWISGIGANLPTALSGLLVAGLIWGQLNWSPFEASAFIGFLYLFLRFGMALGNAGNYAGTLASLYPYFQQTIRYFFSFDDAFVNHSLMNTARIDAMGTQHSKRIAPIGKSVESPKSAPEIRFEDLEFRYPEATRTIFKNLSLTIRPGQVLGLKGESGAGKSTLVALLLGILAPTRGRVLLNGEDPSKYLNSPDALAGYVGAEPYVIEGTLRDNLCFGARRSYSDAEMIEQLNRVHLWSELTRQGMDLNSRLSEFGEGLSAGQKQRLSLARALLLKPVLLILDEATANLDEKNEARIMDAVRALKGEITLVMISHRPAPMQVADQVLELKSEF